ncbi:MAG TPA: chemotaxis protein, partial [Thermoanaerobacter sp.]|nr:chemotaxis protein [Thermoanaerobacter sp.]
MKSIKTKLLVFMLLLILIPLVIAGYFSTNI